MRGVSNSVAGTNCGTSQCKSAAEDLLVDIDGTQALRGTPRTSEIVTITAPEASTVSPTFPHLPADIWIAVILEARSITHNGEEKRNFILNISRVCREWRQLALTSPTLWTDISIPELDLKTTHQFLGRSKNVALDVVMTIQIDERGNDAFSTTAVDLIIGQIHRIRELRIYFVVRSDAARSRDRLDRIMNQLCQQPAPRLERLCLDAGETDWPQPETPMQMPTQLFDNGSVSALKEVEINAFNTTWSLPFFRGLTRLTVTPAVNHWPTASDILSILDACPDLRFMDMVPYVNLRDRWESMPNGEAISDLPLLPAVTHTGLEHLYCTMDFREQFQLFRSLRAPALRRWKLMSTRTALSDITRVIAQAVPPFTKCDHVQCFIRLGVRTMSVTQRFASGFSMRRGLVFNLSQQFPITADACLHAFTNLLRSTNMGQASHVSIRGSEWVETVRQETWQDLLTSLPRMENLEVAGHDVVCTTSGENLLRALRASHENSKAIIIGAAKPKLQQLRLAGFLSQSPTLLGDELVAFAEARSLSGSPLTKLNVRRLKGLSKHHTILLANFVESLYADDDGGYLNCTVGEEFFQMGLVG